MIPYLLIAIPCCSVSLFKGDITVADYLLRVSTISYWLNGWGLWFIALLIPLYLITPLLNIILTKNSFRLLSLILLIAIVWLICPIILPSHKVQHVQFVLGRLPSFFIGIYYSNDIMNNRCYSLIKLLTIWLSLFGLWGITRLLLNITLSFFWIEGLLVVFALILIIDKFNKCRIISIMNAFGEISLESYCTNVLLLNFIMVFLINIPYCILKPSSCTVYLTGTIVCLVISFIVNRVSRNIINKIFT